MEELGVDIETYSAASLVDCGLYRYAEDPTFALLLFAYSVDGAPAVVVDVAQGEELPAEVRAALTDPSVKKTAFNAAFERVCLSRYLGVGGYLDPAQWDCTMAMAARCGLPLSLAGVGAVLNLPDQKMKEGAALIRKFCCPVKPTKANGMHTRNLPTDDPEAWGVFKSYNVRDVDVEQAIRRTLATLAETTDEERAVYVADQRINDRGVKIDRTLAINAAKMDADRKAELADEARRLTGLENPNSVAQLKAWIKTRTGILPDTLNKKEMPDLLKATPDKAVQRLLAIRAEMGKTSTNKYGVMLECACADDRVRGLMMYYGAARTGRWAGRLVQMQNLPQNHLPDLGYAREIVRHGDREQLAAEFGDTISTLSELVRTAFVAADSCTLHVCDFSAIEARVIAWLAGEQWVLDTFRNGGDIYCATASKMFGVPVEKHGVNAPLRQKGKIATLALGYQGGTGALAAMGAERMGLTEAEMKEIVKAWRKANPNIVRLWRDAEACALSAIGGTPASLNGRGVHFTRRRGCLLIKLPSGRTLCYPRARALDNGRIGYEGTNQTTKAWGEVESYGGKITENIVQAIARDCLAEILLKLDAQGLPVVFHVHDEVIVESGRADALGEIKKVFATPPTWAQDLPLVGAGYSTPYYIKD